MSRTSTKAKAARSWLREKIASNEQAYKDFLADKSDIREQILNDLLPYQRGPLPPEIGGIILPLLLSWAETTVAGHHFLRRLIAGLVRCGEPVPEAWREFHANVLDGTTVELPSPKGRKAVNERRDEVIGLLVSVLQIQFDLPRLANGYSRSGNSALEIVKDELSSVLPSLRSVQLDALEKAILRTARDRLSDPILGVMDRRT